MGRHGLGRAKNPFFLFAASASTLGVATVTLGIPFEVSLRGATLHAQAFVVDSQAALGIAFSAGQRLVIGD